MKLQFLNTPRIQVAHAFMKAAHEAIGQKRKYTNDPYFIHPEEVAQMVFTVQGNENTIIAALLHDTVEDTNVTLAEIEAQFGPEVAGMVEALTDCPKEVGNRAKRKALDRERLAKASAEVQTIKLADLINNSQSIVEHDPKFAVVYLREKAALLEVLTKGNRNMRDVARYVLANAQNNLAQKA